MAIEHREEFRAQPIEPLEEISLWVDSKERTVKLGAHLSEDSKRCLMDFLRANSEVFTWSHEDMLGIDPNVITHRLNIRPKVKLVIQRKRSFASEKRQAIQEEVGKLLKSRYIKEVNYPS